LPKVCLFRFSVDGTPIQDGRTDEQTAGCVYSAGVAPTRSGAPDSLLAGLADPPEDWPAASPCDAAAMITREPKRDFGW